ncbi:MAG: GMC family oxidoreductase [Thiolinea sp.]
MSSDPAQAAGTCDYLIIGAGSAGCVLASRLSAQRQNRVLLLEAGGSDLSPWLQIPLGYGRSFYDPRVNWMYDTEAEPGLQQRQGYWPRGKVLGGSGSITAMVWMRGLPLDFERWAAAGNPGWGWDEVLTTYQRIEQAGGDRKARQERDGRLCITPLNADSAHPLNQTFFSAARQCGFDAHR